MKRLCTLLALLLLGCPSSEGDDDDSAPGYPDVELYDFEEAAPWYECPGDFPDEAVVVQAFDREDQSFGDPNLRTIEAPVTFPEGDWAQVGLRLELECPESGRCDHWDRAGSVQLVLDPDAEERESVELLRFITPYRVEMCNYIDITPLAGLLTGSRAVTSWIDTWVGPGHAQGEGWRTSVDFVFYPGPPAGAQVVSVWPLRNITSGETGDGQSPETQVEPESHAIPADATRVLAHVTTTGHSFGNSWNCAEFCRMQHDVILDGQRSSWFGWRDDCDANPVQPQYGTWEHPRNGWCPGAPSVGGLLDVTDLVTPGEEVEVDFEVLLGDGTEYVNTDPVDLLPYTYVALRLYAYPD